jgi:hypothetical protein
MGRSATYREVMVIEHARTVGDLTARLSDRLRMLMPSGFRRSALTAALSEAFGGSADPVDAAALRDIETVAQRHARHIELRSTSSDQDQPELPGWPAPNRAEIQAKAAGFSSVCRVPGACLVRLDSLESLGVSQPYLAATAALAVGAPRLILDLRANAGGDVATVAALAGWLLGDDSRQLCEVIYQTHRRQWWTPALPLGTAYRGEVEVLVSNRTYSSAEALAYHLSVRGRAMVIGETTRGAADHIVPVRLARRVLAFLPEAEVRDSETEDNWEQTGVVPDVLCPADEALDRVLPLA